MKVLGKAYTIQGNWLYLWYDDGTVDRQSVVQYPDGNLGHGMPERVPHDVIHDEFEFRDYIPLPVPGWYEALDFAEFDTSFDSAFELAAYLLHPENDEAPYLKIQAAVKSRLGQPTGIPWPQEVIDLVSALPEIEGVLLRSRHPFFKGIISKTILYTMLQLLTRSKANHQEE